MDLFVAASHQTGLWHKVKTPKADKSGNKADGEFGNESRLEPCCSMQLIDPLSAMWV